MTSLSVHRQGALETFFRDGFWNSGHDSLIAFHSNFIFEMHGFRENRFTGMGISYVQEYKIKNLRKLITKENVTRPICRQHLASRLLIGPKPTLTLTGLVFFITLSHTPHLKSPDIRLWLWRRVEVSCVSSTTADAINTAKPCLAACDR